MIYNISSARSAIEMLYDWKCDIVEFKSIKDDVTKITSNKEITVLENIPCKISFKNTNNATVQDDKKASVSQDIKLIISPDVVIKEGSKIIAKKDGIKREYSRSGIPANYSTHQEIPLKKFVGWI
jgi:hypothetical protein